MVQVKGSQGFPHSFYPLNINGCKGNISHYCRRFHLKAASIKPWTLSQNAAVQLPPPPFLMLSYLVVLEFGKTCLASSRPNASPSLGHSSDSFSVTPKLRRPWEGIACHRKKESLMCKWKIQGNSPSPNERATAMSGRGDNASLWRSPTYTILILRQKVG